MLWRSNVHFADTSEEVRKAAREEIAEGADFVKIFASGAAAISTGVPKQSIMFPEEICSAVETAERKGCYVAAHCHGDDAIRTSILAGVKTIEHATLISDETLELAAEKKSWLIPTLAVMMYLTDQGRLIGKVVLVPCCAIVRKRWQKRMRWECISDLGQTAPLETSVMTMGLSFSSGRKNVE